jgi:hypothetical protein
VADPASTDSRSSSGSSRPASHRRPLTPNRSLHGGRPFSRRCSTAWISFFAASARARAARGAQAAAASRGSAHRASRPTQAPRARATPPACARRACRSSRGPARSRCHPGTDHDHPVHVRLEQPRDLPTRCRSPPTPPDPCSADSPPASRSPPACSAPAPRSGPSPSSQIATTQKSRCTSRPIARPAQLRQRHNSPPQSPLPVRENQRDNDTDRYELIAQSRQVAGAAERKARARSPSRQTGLPVYVLPEGPYPGSTEPTNGAGQTLHTAVSCREQRASCERVAARPVLGDSESGRRRRRRPGARACFWANSESGRRRRRRPGCAPPFTRRRHSGVGARVPPALVV